MQARVRLQTVCEHVLYILVGKGWFFSKKINPLFNLSIYSRIASYNSLRLDRSWLKEELDEVSRSLVLQSSTDAAASRSGADLRDIATNARIRRHSLVLFFIWWVNERERENSSIVANAM